MSVIYFLFLWFFFSFLQLIFFCALLITLVPAHLLEFRYFTPPIVVSLLNGNFGNNVKIMKNSTGRKTKTFHVGDDVARENVRKKTRIYFPIKGLSSHYISLHAPILFIILCFCSINFITIFIFLFKPFAWNDGSLARFMYWHYVL